MDILQEEPSLEKLVGYPSHDNYPRLSKPRIAVFPPPLPPVPSLPLSEKTEDLPEQKDLFEQMSIESDIDLKHVPSLPFDFSPPTSPKIPNVPLPSITYPKDPRISVHLAPLLPPVNPSFREYFSDNHEIKPVPLPKLHVTKSQPVTDVKTDNYEQYSDKSREQLLSFVSHSTPISLHNTNKQK
ncbi:hypothetical protein RFI_21071 [Reticulomyxa filosa]|uniref:Uncharacterized protein n=1 Tax=Reticulomyxa filosa TaxID=46433 RepID=X6MQZ7_RETFI|nr:hypothetical protein RFI_21071 [Reticulomyxa filosa]|eukprot:ETO16284.1 hypothetical protein RFI_21071 [Reticulomyxa filosa]